MFRRFLFSRIRSSAQDHAVLVLSLNLVGVFISVWPRWSSENDFCHSCTSLEGASRGGQTLNTFTWFKGAGGWQSPDTLPTTHCWLGGWKQTRIVQLFGTKNQCWDSKWLHSNSNHRSLLGSAVISYYAEEKAIIVRKCHAGKDSWTELNTDHIESRRNRPTESPVPGRGA